MEVVLRFVQRHRFLLEAIGIVLITGIIGIIIGFYQVILGWFRGTGETSAAEVPVVINEVSVAFMEDDPRPHQWLELYNRTGNQQVLEGWSIGMGAEDRLPLPPIHMPPHGYAIVAASAEQFLADHPGYPGVVVSPTVPWPGLDRQNDFVVLRNARGAPTDVVNWGKAVEAPADVTLWPSANIGGGAGWLFDKDGKVAVEHTFERRPVGTDHNSPSDFTRQPYPSPGTVNAPSATRANQLLLTDWTNVASYAAGILLWIAFVYIGLIARRFEALTRQRTFWQAMLVAPSGILFYNIVQAYGFLTRGSMLVGEQWVSFVVLFVSALFCAILVYIFRRRARRILEG